MNSTQQLLLTPKEAAIALAISPRNLWSLKSSGEIPHVRISRSVRYSLGDLRRWIAAQTKGGVA
ncbi:MAG: helix-turn-helix domain-containing protein [Planctomycetota bacterium]|nr:helix-turn-helix domain-containing protein [Planctomycetota bacterium]